MVVHSAAFLWAFWTLIAIYFVQWLVASTVKARQPGAIPGKLPDQLSHDSFVFRTHRTYMNSLENAPLILGAVALAWLSESFEFWLALWLWVYVAARVGHMLCYYAIATEKNPSPRSYFFIIGVVANLALFILATIQLVDGL